MITIKIATRIDLMAKKWEFLASFIGFERPGIDMWDVKNTSANAGKANALPTWSGVENSITRTTSCTALLSNDSGMLSPIK